MKDLLSFQSIKIRRQRKAKRIGRGRGSGKGGHTVGQGSKGHKARHGGRSKLGFEGGQLPFYKRLPRFRGMRWRRRPETVAVKLSLLRRFKSGTSVEPKTLVLSGLLERVPAGGVKLIGKGGLSGKLLLSGFRYSQAARAAIEAAGGKIAKVAEENV